MALVVLTPAVGVAFGAYLALTSLLHPSTTSDRIDLVKTALGTGAGAGGLVTLVLAGRRQWSTEYDSAARRITELYTKAADQLGSDKAPVRLAGLYSLERLAQDNPGQRQSIVNLICAYLRMPYKLPLDSNQGDAPSEAHLFDPAVQEKQVRLAAQEVLHRHLTIPKAQLRSYRDFWESVDLNLSGATLIDINFSYCEMNDGIFDKAEFFGDSSFFRTIFGESASFEGATFHGKVAFGGVEFEAAEFSEAVFRKEASLIDCRFRTSARFERIRNSEYIAFTRSTFYRGASFGNARLRWPIFKKAIFVEEVHFGGTYFYGPTDMRTTKFEDEAWFSESRFYGAVHFPSDDAVQYVDLAFTKTSYNDKEYRIGVGCWILFETSDANGVPIMREFPPGHMATPTEEQPPGEVEGGWARLVRFSEEQDGEIVES